MGTGAYRTSALLLGLALFAGCAGPSVEAPPPSSEHERVICLEAELRVEAPGDFERRWRLARAWLRLVDHPATSDRLEAAERALEHAAASVRIDTERAEGHYYQAISLGRVLEHSTLPDLGLVSELEAAGKRAREIDPSFSSGGPLRFLALLYQKAPPWPIGPELAGEEDVIEELFLEALCRAPECGENHLVYAEFLREYDRDDESLVYARKAAELLPGDDLYPRERVELESRVRDLLEALRLK